MDFPAIRASLASFTNKLQQKLLLSHETLHCSSSLLLLLLLQRGQVQSLTTTTMPRGRRRAHRCDAAAGIWRSATLGIAARCCLNVQQVESRCHGGGCNGGQVGQITRADPWRERNCGFFVSITRPLQDQAHKQAKFVRVPPVLGLFAHRPCVGHTFCNNFSGEALAITMFQ